MNLYLDTEFNGHGGELISLAIACPDGNHWYRALPLPSEVHPWVAQHVVPKIIIDVSTPSDFRQSLQMYLASRVGCTIWADWPDDFAHLMSAMSGPSYEQSFVVGCTMKLITTPDGEPKPENPHNALSDALALMRWHQSHLSSRTRKG